MVNIVCANCIVFFVVDENDKQETTEENLNNSTGGRSNESQGHDSNHTNNGYEQDENQSDKEPEEEKGEENVSNDYDTDIPITNLGVNNPSNTQSISSNLQGIAT